MFLLPIKFEHEILGPPPWLNWTLGCVSLAVFFGSWVFDWSVDDILLRKDAAPWTWLSYGFAHANLFHLVGNMLFAWIFGNTLERQLGPPCYALLYVIGLILSGAAQLAWTPDVAILGASGAIYALIGFEVARHPHRRIRFCWWFVFRWGHFLGPVWLLLPIGAAFDLLAWLEGNHSIATAGHLAGFGTGWILGRIFRPAAPTAVASSC